MAISIAVSGASGSVGRALIAAILENPEFKLVAASSRSLAGQNIAEALGLKNTSDVQAVSTVEAALACKPAVLIDYTHVSVALEHCQAAIAAGVNLVLGTSGLSKTDLEELGQQAKQNNVGIFAAGNFSITAAMLQYLGMIAAKHLPTWEVIDYGKPKYVHVPSSTGRELVDKLAAVKQPEKIVPPDQAYGMKEARGATVSGTQIHSIRAPGYGFSIEAIFSLPGERLTLRHDASESPQPYVHGTLLAAREVIKFTGLKRGIESVLFNQQKDCI